MEIVQKHQMGINSQTSDSSAGSTAPVGRGESAIGKDGARIGGGRGVAGPLSPKRTVELSGKGREGPRISKIIFQALRLKTTNSNLYLTCLKIYPLHAEIEYGSAIWRD